MSILVATDFSPCSFTATRLAVALARRRRASLVLLHTVEPFVVDPAAAPLIGEWDAAMITAAEQALAQQAEDLRKTGIDVEVRVQPGWPGRTILENARALKPELIVLGTHGRRGAARLFLGSCAEEVVRSSSCPVLVTSANPAGIDRWEAAEPLRLTIATDGSPACEAAYAWVRTSATTTTNHVSLVRAYWPPQEAKHYGLEQAWLDQEGHPDVVRLLERDLRRDAQALAGAQESPIRFRVAWQNVGEAIADDVRQLGADAMVIGVPAHHRGTRTGMSPASILRSATVPVFCVPEAAQPKQRHIPKVASVLIAFDLSETSRAVILPAYGLLLGGGRAELCFVHDRGPANALDGLPAKPALTDDERASIDSQLRAATPTESAEHGISTRTSVLEGLSAAEVILQAAERLNVDVIAVGSKGRSGVARALMGSVAEHVARKSTRPVLVVHGVAR
ncbi:MAG TPA: universal stress protein [Polyangia bacterium]|nr:universal stress protein [Polyangia bacterium]